MTAPAGAIVSIYVDLVQRVASGDVVETQTGRRYGVLAVRVQQRGKHEGRQHLRCIVVGAEGVGFDAPWRAMVGGEGDRLGTLHRIRWYARGRGKR